ncbi:hypothetical protein NEICINOT_04737 [Neisseria cinerea ATCC 14685]|uniref:Uncharacterized protein n=1 Tax=Neisseria cinerea ATCC 14685 TaxID=546262 RepID=D0W4Y8_NEICI|nr:hypothetical protein NEICINOT_04737 [Neisseria cinerea ATCC 14685]
MGKKCRLNQVSDGILRLPCHAINFNPPYSTDLFEFSVLCRFSTIGNNWTY